MPKPEPKPVNESLVFAEDMAKPFARLDADRFRRLWQRKPWYRAARLLHQGLSR